MLQNLKVLIIDDDEDDYFITHQYLLEIESMVVNCDWCYRINEALQKLKSNTYDIYFMDYRLGARTGLDLMREAIASGCSKPVILLTGKGTPEIDKLAMESGAYDYLIKSEINTEKMERCLRYAMERYKNFKLINDNEKKFRLIFENALSFIFTCGESLVFNECNPAAEYFLNYTPSELKGTSLLRYIEPSYKEQFIRQVQARKNIRNLHIKFVSKQGEVKSGNMSLTYFEDENLAVHWQGIVYDETLRLQNEKNKLQAQKIDATYRLVRTLAHEIRNPLTNIGLSAEAMDTPKESEQQSYLEIIKRSYARINDILSELLQSSQTVEIKPELVDLNFLLRDVLEQADDRRALKNIRIHLVVPDFPVVKILDREKFKIAILNLVVNAIEATEQDKGEIELQLIKNLDHTIITVKDNGHGIQPDDVKRLFEPYYSTKKSGTGLGLVSTLNIVKSHNAIIEVETTYLQGTTFKVVFPEQTGG